MASQFDTSGYAERLAKLAHIILAPDRAFFWQAVMFSVAISVLTLAVPLSVQILIGSVANIALLRPIVVLALVLFALLIFYGVLVGIQAHLMDVFERRLFARVTQEIAMRIDLLARHIEPDRGAILFAGRNFADLNVQALRDDIIVIENSGVLERSIEDNLSLGDPAITRAAVRDGIAAVGLESVINTLPDGLGTRLGAFGYPLSRSETVRLKIAAALLARPRVLILTQIFDTLKSHHRRQILERLTREPKLTLLNFTNRQDFEGYGSYLYLDDHRHWVFERIADLTAFEQTRRRAAPDPSAAAS